MTRSVLAIIAATIALAPSSSLRAQPETVSGVSPAEMQRARALFAEGQALVEEARYEQALDKFSAAYELSKLPGFLFNMAECARLAGDTDEAGRLYQRHLDEVPDGDLAELSRRRLAELGAAKPQASPTSGAAPSEAAENRRSFDWKTAPDRDSSPGLAKRITGISIAGLGAAMVVGGVSFGLKASRISSDLDEQFGPGSEWTDEATELEADYRSARKAAISLGVVGGVAAALGGGLYYWGHRDRGAADDSVAVLPARGGGMAVWTRSF